MALQDKLTHDPTNAYCPVRATLALLGQKWVPHILFELMGGKRRFNDLGQRIGGCNSRTLRDRLRGLEEMGVVERRIVTVMPPWVEYELYADGQGVGDGTRRDRGLGQAPPCGAGVRIVLTARAADIYTRLIPRLGHGPGEGA